jgi:hypothetical protein
MRVSAALNAIGHKLRSLSFLPKENLHNIVEFQVVMNRYEVFQVFMKRNEVLYVNLD